MKIRQIVCGALVFCLAASLASVSEEAAKAPAPKIQIALLLDTSNSMDGLINQAKAQLWKVVNEFVTAEREGARPDFQVALYEYGNNGLEREKNWIRRVLPLTDDLDKVSQELFALTTNGGDEYCGAVIARAVADLEWSADKNDLKTIFIAGNEPFDQGGIDFRKSCGGSIKQGIMINTIFCGRKSEGIETKWQEGALLADGSYMNIDQNEVQVTINAPQDDEIIRLGQELNSTYVAFGRAGTAGAMNQEAQDLNAMSVHPSSNVQRQVTKANVFYKNSNWDLVDALEEGKVELNTLESEALPPELQGKSEEELQKLVEEKKQKREELQERINKLNEERKAYVAAEEKKRAEAGAETLDSAMIKAVKEQAKQKNFTFKN